MNNIKRLQMIVEESKKMYDTVIAEGAKKRFAEITTMYFNHYYNTEEYSRLVDFILSICSKIADAEIWADTYFYILKMADNAKSER